jgi:ribosomal protein S27E
LRATDDAGEWAEVAVNVEVRHVLQPPRFIAAMPNVTVEEGDTVFSAFNLLDFVFDPDNPKTSLIFSVADISNPNISVSMDINDNIEVRSKAGWDGVAVVKMKVSDGELSAIAAFNVTVVRHNRPPVIGQLPPVQLEQDGSLERSFNLLNFTTDTDTPRQNLTFRIDDNTNPRSGVSVSTDGWVNIRPDKGWSGTAIIVVNVSDGEYGVRASFTVTITPKAVTPVPVPAQDNTMLFYILILLVVVMMAFLAVDIGMRLRRPGQPPLRPSAPSAPEPGGPAVVVKKVRARPAEAPAEEEAKAPGGTPPIEVQPESPAPEAPPGPSPGQTPPAQSVQQAAEAPAAPQYGPPTEGISPAPESGAMAPVPSSPEAPPESVPDMTPGDGFTEAGQAPGEPETMDMDRPAEPVEASYGAPEQGPEQGPPAPEIGAGEVEQRPSAQSAASLLAALQKPVPKLESEGPGPAPEPASGAPPAPGPPPEAADIGDRIEAAMVSKATESEHDATEVEQKEDVKPITRVRCAGCRAAIPIFSAQRPLVVTCPQCGRMGMLK